jgi:hypothetical protein
VIKVGRHNGSRPTKWGHIGEVADEHWAGGEKHGWEVWPGWQSGQQPKTRASADEQRGRGRVITDGYNIGAGSDSRDDVGDGSGDGNGISNGVGNGVSNGVGSMGSVVGHSRGGKGGSDTVGGRARRLAGDGISGSNGVLRVGHGGIGGNQGRHMVGALHWVGSKHRWSVCGRTLFMACTVHGDSTAEVAGDQGPVATSKCINIRHHAGRTVHNVEAVAQEFLRPAANLMNGSVIFQNLLDTTAVAKPVEGGAPKIFAVLIDGPSTYSGLPNKRVIVLFLGSAAAGAKPDWPKAGTLEGEVKLSFTGEQEVG